MKNHSRALSRGTTWCDLVANVEEELKGNMPDGGKKMRWRVIGTGVAEGLSCSRDKGN